MAMNLAEMAKRFVMKRKNKNTGEPSPKTVEAGSQRLRRASRRWDFDEGETWKKTRLGN